MGSFIYHLIVITIMVQSGNSPIDVAVRYIADRPCVSAVVSGPGKEFLANYILAAIKEKTASNAPPIIYVEPKTCSDSSAGVLKMSGGNLVPVQSFKQKDVNLSGTIVYASLDNEVPETSGDVRTIMNKRKIGGLYEDMMGGRDGREADYQKIIILSNDHDHRFARSVDWNIALKSEDYKGAKIMVANVESLEQSNRAYFTIAEAGSQNMPIVIKDQKTKRFIPLEPYEIEWENVRGNFKPVTNPRENGVSVGSFWLDWMLKKSSGKMGLDNGSNLCIFLGRYVGDKNWPIILNYNKNNAALGRQSVKICSPGTSRGKIKERVNDGLMQEEIERIAYFEYGTIADYDPDSSLPVSMGLNALEDSGTDAEKRGNVVNIVDEIEKHRIGEDRMGIDISLDALHLGDPANFKRNVHSVLMNAEKHGDTVLAYLKQDDESLKSDMQVMFANVWMVDTIDDSGIPIVRPLRPVNVKNWFYLGAKASDSGKVETEVGYF